MVTLTLPPHTDKVAVLFTFSKASKHYFLVQYCLTRFTDGTSDRVSMLSHFLQMYAGKRKEAQPILLSCFAGGTSACGGGRKRSAGGWRRRLNGQISTQPCQLPQPYVDLKNRFPAMTTPPATQLVHWDLTAIYLSPIP